MVILDSDMEQRITDKEFKIVEASFKGYPIKDQWMVKVHRTWDDGEGYSGDAWRDVQIFDTKTEAEEFVNSQTLIDTIV